MERPFFGPEDEKRALDFPIQVRCIVCQVDGCGRAVRNGLNFTERGFGVRAALGVSDRGHTAAAQLKPGDIDWEHLFGTLGVRWFHTGGIFAALSETTAPLVVLIWGAIDSTLGARV